MNIIAICKDCGNGTLNGETNPQFIMDDEVVRCMNCSSSHVDVVSITEEEDCDCTDTNENGTIHGCKWSQDTERVAE